MTYQDLAEKYKINYNTAVKLVGRALRLSAKGRNRIFTPEEIVVIESYYDYRLQQDKYYRKAKEQVAALYKQGLKLSEIIRTTGYRRESVRKWLSDLGLRIPKSVQCQHSIRPPREYFYESGTIRKRDRTLSVGEKKIRQAIRERSLVSYPGYFESKKETTEPAPGKEYITLMDAVLLTGLTAMDLHKLAGHGKLDWAANGSGAMILEKQSVLSLAKTLAEEPAALAC